MIFDEQIKEKGIRLELEKTKRLNKKNLLHEKSFLIRSFVLRIPSFLPSFLPSSPLCFFLFLTLEIWRLYSSTAGKSENMLSRTGAVYMVIVHLRALPKAQPRELG
jgi:hypothetical protein